MRKTPQLTRFVTLLSLTLAVEMIGLPQPITGPLINALLLLIALFLTPGAAAAAGCLTPLLALLRGLLPPLLWPTVPLIALGNVLWVFVFYAVARPRSRPANHLAKSVRAWLGLFAAAACKTLWLFAGARLILPFLFGVHLPEKFLGLLAAPQLFTALSGGVLVFILHRHLIPVLQSPPR